MKTMLLAFLCVALLTQSTSFAQPCGVNNLSLEKVYTGNDGKCYADFFFDLDRNPGNKFIYVHLWNQENFGKVDKTKFGNIAGPQSSVLNGSAANPHPALATLSINNNNVTAPVWSDLNYQPDASVKVVRGKSLQVSATPVSGSGAKALYRYWVKGVALSLTGGGCVAANINGIAWTTQANSNVSHIHCSQIGKTEQPFTMPMQSNVSCANGSYEVNLINTTNQAVSGSLVMLAGTTGTVADESFNPEASEIVDRVDYFSAAPGQSVSIKRQVPAKHLGKTLFSHVALSDLGVKVQKISTAGCGVLPVRLTSFTAKRNRQQVMVQWQTGSEQSVRGFNILRQTGSNEWTTIAFVPSQAGGGASSTVQSYQYNDLNSFKGISRYRIEEVSASGSASLSEVKTVRGEEIASALSLFPNPTFNGNVSLVFDNAAVKDILVLDMSGRVVKQWKNIAAANVQLENLKSGFYSIQVINQATNAIAVEKLLVK